MHAVYCVRFLPGDRLDLGIAHVLDGLHRLRADRQLHLVRMFNRRTQRAGVRPGRIEPMDPAAALESPDGEAEVSLLPAFCSRPVPKVVADRDRDGEVVYRLATRKLGAGGATRVAVGQVLRGLASPLAEAEAAARVLDLTSTVTTPVARLVMDVLVCGGPELAERARSLVPMIGYGLDSPDTLRTRPVRRVASPADLSDATTPDGGELAARVLSATGVNAPPRVLRLEVPYPLLLSRTAVSLTPGA